MSTRQKAKQQWAIHSGGAGFVQDSFVVVVPSVPHPEGDVIFAGSWPAGGKLKHQFSRLAGSALLQRNGLQSLLGSVAQQLGAFRADSLFIVEGGSAAAVEIVR